jgi:hypothetical protein
VVGTRYEKVGVARLRLIFFEDLLRMRAAGQSLYPYMRLIMPEIDRERRNYRLGVKNWVTYASCGFGVARLLSLSLALERERE